MNDYNSRLTRILTSISAVEAENRLMASSDRELAVAMLYMDDTEKASLLARIAPRKAARVVEELALQRHLNVRYEQYELVVTRLMARLTGSGRVEAAKSYLRPRGSGSTARGANGRSSDGTRSRRRP